MDRESRSALVLDAQHPAQHDGHLLELRTLPDSRHPDGEIMRATLTFACPEFTRPAYSSICLGLFPAAATMVGEAMSFGMTCQ